MSMHHILRVAVIVVFALTTSVWSETCDAQDSATKTAARILAATGVKGGLVVHIGCSDGVLTRAMRVNERYLVHGLDTDPARVARTRRLLHDSNLYGPVSADCFDGRNLPYVDGIVNLVVAQELGDVTSAEIRRVLAPEGVAYVRRNGTWDKTTKERSSIVDEWTHFLHDASGNAVAADECVGPPTRLRWVAGPRWCRSHEFPSSVAAAVTSGGRVFTIFDEGPTGVYERLPQHSMLVARDAYNGVLLWKAPLKRWQPEFGTGRGNRWNIHHTIPRRLVAQDSHVYATLGFLHSPVSVLDAATGEVLTEALGGTKGTDEMVLSDDILVVKITKDRSVAATARINTDSLNDALAAVDTATGRQLWRKENIRVIPYALAALSGRVVYHNLEEITCIDLKTGEQLWRTPHRILSTLGAVSTLLIHDDVVLFHGHGQVVDDDKKSKRGFYLTAVNLSDGRILWKRRGGRGQAAACTQPTDLFVVDGTIWCGGSLDGYDLRTGRVEHTLSLDKLISPGHHYRCHRSKATQRFLIWPKRGAEFVDVSGNDHMRHDWLRAPCFTGLMPANGLLYVPPSQCFCYPGVKVSGFLAMSTGGADEVAPPGNASLERGPAYGTVPDTYAESAADWPMYRRDIQRSGSTQMSMPAELRRCWDVDLACAGSQAVVADNRLWIAEKEAHRIRCLDVSTGEDVWDFTAGARIDSAPTVHKGCVLFGCRDGSVYCLRATDGALVWRFDAAPEDRRTVAYGQLESLWPVKGSVLVQKGVVYFAAGRSSFLDGGIMVYALNAQTGDVLHRHHLQGPQPDVRTDVGSPFAMEGALPDLMVSDGDNLYMQRIKFDGHLNRLPTEQESSLGELDMGSPHLVATGGFLDDTGFDRLYWMHSRRWPGFYFAQHAPKSGQLVVFDSSTVYAVKYFYRRIQWSPAFIPGDKGYLLFADGIDNEPALLGSRDRQSGLDWLPQESYTDKHRRGGREVEKGTGYVRQQPPKWQQMIPVRIRAMVLADDLLFVAGPPDVVEPDDPLAAFQGRKGALLQAFSANGGSLRRSYELSSPPAFDGLCAAQGRLFLSTSDGKLLCFGPADRHVKAD